MFGYYQRPTIYRRAPSMFDQYIQSMYNMERAMRAQRTIERALFPELFLPKMYLIIQKNKNDQEKSQEKPTENKKEQQPETPKKEEEKQPEQPAQEKPIEQKEEENIEQSKPQEEKQEETQKENSIKPKQEQEKKEKEEKEIQQNEEKDQETEKNEDIDDEEVIPHELNDESYSIQKKTYTKSNGKIKHTFIEEHGLTSGITKTKEIRSIGDRLMSLTRLSYPDGRIEEHEELENLNNDEDLEAFKEEWIKSFPIKQESIQQEETQ